MKNTHHEQIVTNTLLLPTVIAGICLILIVLYVWAVIVSNRNKRQWPVLRSICFLITMLFIWVSVVGPFSMYGDDELNFTSHMIGHLLLGMLAPLLLTLAAPLTLVLRTLPTKYARQLSSILKSKLSFFFTHPVVTVVLNIGGLWLLYTTPLFAWMHTNEWVYWLVHIHIFLAGYLFTISIIYINPIYHRKSFRYRAIALIFALAGHSILSKYIYANPPNGVSVQQAELGSMLMYYGGDIIDASLIFILCLQWYKATRPKKVKTKRAEAL